MIDLSNIEIQPVEGTISKLVSSNINMTALQTSPLNNLACNTPINSINVLSSGVIVSVNGLQVNLGDDDACDCYFSNNGVDKKPLDSIVVGDKLYWNYIDGNPISGYDLSISDRITFNYLTR